MNKNIINESVNRYDLIDAIKNRKVIYIYYSGIDGKSANGKGVTLKGYRTIEPYLIGITTSGNLALRAWQQNGASDAHRGITRNPPRPDHDILAGWRLFYVDGITSMLLTGKNFNPKKNLRPNYNSEDEQMKEIIYAINVDDSDLEVDGIDSIKQNDKISGEISTFDTQSKKFRDFYDDKKNKRELLKKTVNDFYELVVKHRKKSPKDYHLINKDGNIIATLSKNINKYDKKSDLGNLKDLFIKFNRNERPSKAFFDRQRELFRKSLEK